MEILKIDNLTKTYNGKNSVSNLHMTINQGDIYGFIGRNGAGKTTTIKMIVGLTKPTSGEIKLFGSKNLNKYRDKIGTVIEAPAFVPHMTAAENMYTQWLLLGNKDKSIIKETLELVGLGGVGKKKAKNFSLGMKQRLGIAMSLMGNPEFLILDEPTNGLDPEGIIEIRELLLKLNKEKNITILISSHILSELSKLATRYGIINDGKLIEEFTAKELDERCTSNLTIKVDDAQKAADVLRTKLDTDKFKIVDDKTIELYEFLNEPGKVNSILAKNEILVETISKNKADLEAYFMKAIGGKTNA